MKERLAISYCRKSIKVKDKTVEESVHYQQQAIQQYAKENQLNIIHSFNDVGYSGKDINRPELQEMIEFLESTNKPVEELIIYSIDRFGRDLQHNIEGIMNVLQYVQRVYFVSERISTDSEHFRLFFLMLTGAAQDERERLMKRLADGRKAKVINRKTFDGNYPPLGFIQEHKSNALLPATKENTEDLSYQVDFTIVQYIYYLYLFHTSLRKIALLLNQKFGLTRRGKRWTYKTVQYILSNPAYCGQLKGRLNKTKAYEISDANIVKMIDPVIFSMIQKKLQMEKTGRKKKTLNRISDLTVCYQCSTKLEQQGNLLLCSSCNTSGESQEVSDSVNQAVQDLFKMKWDESAFKEAQENLLKKEQVKYRKTKKHLLMLEEHRTLIEHWDARIETKTKLLEINSNEIKKYHSEKRLSEIMIEYLQQINHEEVDYILKQQLLEYCMKLPYLISVDLVEKQVVLLFYKSIFLDKGDIA